MATKRMGQKDVRNTNAEFTKCGPHFFMHHRQWTSILHTKKKLWSGFKMGYWFFRTASSQAGICQWCDAIQLVMVDGCICFLSICHLQNLSNGNIFSSTHDKLKALIECTLLKLDAGRYVMCHFTLVECAGLGRKIFLSLRSSVRKKDIGISFPRPRKQDAWSIAGHHHWL